MILRIFFELLNRVSLRYKFLVRSKTIVFGKTYVLAQVFLFIFSWMRDLRDAWADRLEILHQCCRQDEKND